MVRWTDTKQTLPIEPENLWRLRGSATSELNVLEPESDLSSRTLNQVEKLNVLEPESEPSSRTLNQCEKLNVLEPESEPSSRTLNQTKRRGAGGKEVASGSLYSYTKNKKLKNGIIATFPRVEGHRDPDNIDHWYWGYKYYAFLDGEWKSRTLPVPKFRVTTVRFMIEEGMSVAAIKALIKGEFAND